MITPLDNQAWSSEIVTGNAQFVEVGTTLYVVSQVRADNTFAVFKSQSYPPSSEIGDFSSNPGTFNNPIATYTFNVFDAATIGVGDGATTQFDMTGSGANIYINGIFQPTSSYAIANGKITFTNAPALGVVIESGNNNSSFDPVVTYDSTSQLLYIIGTQDNANGNSYDVLLFTFSMVTNTLTTPVVLLTASYIRDSYDICTLGYSVASPPAAANVFIAVAATNPTQVWGIPTVVEILNPTTGSPPVVTPNLAINISNNYLTVYGSFPMSWVGKSVTFSGLQNATFLNGATVTIMSVGVDTNGTFLTAEYVYDDYTLDGYESGFVTWVYGHTLLGIELDPILSSPPTLGLVGITLLDSSPFRTGNTFGAVSVYSPDGYDIEVYYESHPKQITFKDQIFSLNQITRSGSTYPSTWLSPISLHTFSGRYADSRLTVIANGDTRTLLQQFFSQLIHQNALVGNLLFGYYDGLTSWGFNIQPGSLTTSYIQGTLSVSEISGSPPFSQTYVSYLAEPIYDIRGVWSPQVKFYNVNDRTTYNGLDYIVNTAIIYPYQGEWVEYTSYNAGDVVSILVSSISTDGDSFIGETPLNDNTPSEAEAQTSPIIAFYTAVNSVSVSTISPSQDTVNWSITPTPVIDIRFTEAPTAWPLHTATLDVTTFNMVDIPGFYNNLSFTWLRGAKTLLDNKTNWGVVGEQILGQGEGDATFGARYVSGFDAPPGVVLSPDNKFPNSYTVLRGTPYLFDASGTNDANLDPLTFIWTFTPSNPNVSLTPISPTNASANLLVNRTIGGAENNFVVGVVATTASHPSMTVTSIGIANNVLTVVTDAPVNLASTESVFLYNIGVATFLNNLEVIVIGIDGNSFTANFTHADYTLAIDTGSAISSPQFDWCNVTVPLNNPPTITFLENPILADRNSAIMVVPIYTGTTDADDKTVYSWDQIAGTPVTVLGGTTSSILQIETNGALIQSESLVWSLTVNDGVNPPVTAVPLTIQVNAYSFQIEDTLRLSRSLWGPYATISQRNTVQTWSPLDVSAIYTNFQNIKRTSVHDGTGRYILISPASVCVYGNINPIVVLLRKLFVPVQAGSPPVQNTIMDAVHTEDDTTLVLDSGNNLYRYSIAPLINTDNPDTTIVLSTITSMVFNKLFSTYSFNNSRILILTGSDGCLLLQVENTTMVIEGSLEITVEAGSLYGIDNVQFVRTSNVESLNTGKILLGTIVPITADIQSIGILNNVVTVEAENTFTAGQVVTFQNLTYATFLNGIKATVVSATSTQFVVSYTYGNYSVTVEGLGATATTGGNTYETLIDLSHGQIIGTFDSSNLRNQYVTTGEILFETNDTYAGVPSAPMLNPIVNNGSVGGGYVSLTVSWVADRPDLVEYYDLEASLNETDWVSTVINSGYLESITLPELEGQYYYFRVRSVSVDGTSPYSNIETISTGGSAPPPVTTVTGFAIEFGVGFGTT